MRHALVVMAFLLNLSASVASAQTTQHCPTITQYLTLGSRSSQVVLLKKFLSTEGFLKGVSNTNYFGPTTATALKLWQQKKGIEATGATGPKTRAALQQCSASTHGEQQSAVTQKKQVVIGTGNYVREVNVSAQAPCMLEGQEVASGAAVVAYKTPTVVAPALCESEFRACKNGVLTGSYPSVLCIRTAPRAADATAYAWLMSDWGACLNATQSRTVSCINSNNAAVDASFCETTIRPAATRSCI